MTRVVLPDEEWRPIPGWEGLYEVSNLGRVYSIKRHGVSRSGRVLSQQPLDSGHRTVSLRRDGYRRQAPVHQLVLLTFAGPRPEGQEVRHLDGDASNNRLTNLRYGTRRQNHLDRALHRDPEQQISRCVNDHPYTPENTYYGSTRPDVRMCRTCLAIRRARPPEERRKPTRIYVRVPIAHGTDRGYNAHLERGEAIPVGDPCGCRRAHADAVAARKAAKRAGHGMRCTCGCVTSWEATA